MKTSINTGTFLLSILQDDYNHNRGLADSYKKLLDNATSKQEKAEFLANYKEFHAKANNIYCQVNKLELMDNNQIDYKSELLEAYRIYSAKKRIEDGEVTEREA